MDTLTPFLYQFLGGGIVLFLGFFGALRVKALDLSSREERLWTVCVFGVVVFYFILQALFQFKFGAS